jgi:hydrogenase expression/formation protein HypC
MCLGELGQILEVGAGAVAEVRVGERVRSVSLLTLEEPVSPGDWVLVHSGFALGRLTADEAHQAEHIRTTTSEDL